MVGSGAPPTYMNGGGRGWTSGREECLTRHACRRFAPACSDKENRRFAPVLPGWDEPGEAQEPGRGHSGLGARVELVVKIHSWVYYGR